MLVCKKNKRDELRSAVSQFHITFTILGYGWFMYKITNSHIRAEIRCHGGLS